MLSILRDPGTLPDSFGYLKDGLTYSESQTIKLSSQEQKSTDIVILTEEGDKVTLSRDSQRQIEYMTYSSLIRGGGAMKQVREKSYSMEVSRELSITVEGDLSDEELKDIQKSIKMIDRIMRAALSGKLDHALAMAQDVGNMDTISGFSANMKVENTVSYEQMLEVETRSSNPESIVGETGHNSQYKDHINQIVDSIVRGLKHRKSHMGRLINPLNSYFSKILEGMAKKHEDPDSASKLGIADLIRSKIIERLEPMAREEVPNTTETRPEQDAEKPVYQT